MVQPASAGGNFEYVAIPRQGLLFLSQALKQHNNNGNGSFNYGTRIWFEERFEEIDPRADLHGVDILMISALINEAPRGYQIAREARAHHPELVIIGGGPHMSPLSEEALAQGFDAIVNREGEDIIGHLCDVLLTHNGNNRYSYLARIPGISYLLDGNLTQTKRTGLVDPGFSRVPDFDAIEALSPGTPLMGGVIETTRGCTEKCTYCQVIQQFLGYRLVARDVELARLDQLQKLAADGIIHASRKGEFSIFISDDLHPPPLRVVKYRDERLARLKAWKGRTNNMYMTCQARTEIAEDPELGNAMLEAGIRMLYLGVESDNAENLNIVKKRQQPGDVDRHLHKLREMGFKIVAMTIIGLPYDTEKSIMNMADWVSEVSDWQTANFLTPLPATSNWLLPPLAADGSELPSDEQGNVPPEIGMRPYHLYTGRQLVHKDERWTMAASRELYDQYSAKLNPVDDFYKSILGASIIVHARKWAAYIAPFFSANPSLAEQVKQAISRPSQARLEDLRRLLAQETASNSISKTLSEGVRLVKSFTHLHGYAPARR